MRRPPLPHLKFGPDTLWLSFWSPFACSCILWLSIGFQFDLDRLAPAQMDPLLKIIFIFINHQSLTMIVLRLSGDYKLAFPPFSSGCSPQSAMAYFKSGYGVRKFVVFGHRVILITGERAPPSHDNDGCGKPAPLNGLPHWPLPLRPTQQETGLPMLGFVHKLRFTFISGKLTRRKIAVFVHNVCSRHCREKLGFPFKMGFLRRALV